MEYYVPRTKGELIRFFVIKMGYHNASLQKMAKSRLYAIYHRVMRGKVNFVTTS